MVSCADTLAFWSQKLYLGPFSDTGDDAAKGKLRATGSADEMAVDWRVGAQG